MADPATETPSEPPKAGKAEVSLPRVEVRYCTQCRWMLRAAYYAQELLSTFSTSIGEVALQPDVGGTFTIHLLHSSSADFTTQRVLLWDRKAEGGFPEVKHLKSLVRNIIDPARSLGHIDRSLAKQHDNNDDNAAKKPLSGGGPATAEPTRDDEDDERGSNGQCKDCA